MWSVWTVVVPESYFGQHAVELPILLAQMAAEIAGVVLTTRNENEEALDRAINFAWTKPRKNIKNACARYSNSDVLAWFRQKEASMNQTILIGHIALIQASKKQDFTLDVIKAIRDRGYDAVGVFAGECREREYMALLEQRSKNWA